jgi:hypothetical protein
MNDMSTIWAVSDERTYGERNKKRKGIMLAVALLCAMAAAEVLFLNYVAGPESVSMMMAAEGVATAD